MIEIFTIRQKDVLRFWKQVEVKSVNECWPWKGWVSSPPKRPTSKYGRFKLNGKGWYSHNLLMRALWGDIPQGYNIDHTCDNKLCQNPNHLQIVTIKKNTERSGIWERNRNKAMCPKGHLYNDENTYHYINAKGTPARACKECRRANRRAYYAKNREREIGYQRSHRGGGTSI